MVCGSCGEATEVAPCLACGQDPRVEGRYELVRALGHGAQGTTWEARTDGRRVAVKEMPLRTAGSKAAELVRREVDVLRQLRHPRIPAYLEHFETGSGRASTLWLVTGYVDGVDLGRRLETHRYSEVEVLRVVRSVAEILAYLHGLSPPVLHRDIKPGNVVRDEAGALWLVDFGSVRDALTDEIGGSTIAGTFGYMAPEQFAGDAEARSDLYGLGALAVALLTRIQPHSLLDVSNTMVWADKATVSPRGRALIDALVAKDPEDRPASAAAVLDALDRIERGEAPSLPVPATPSLPAVTQPRGLASALFGASRTLQVATSSPVPFAALEVDRAVAVIESAFGLSGRVRLLGGRVEWNSRENNRDVTVRLEPHPGGTRVAVSGRIGRYIGGVYAGLIVGGATGLVAGIGPALVSGIGVLGAIAACVAGFAALWLVAWLLVARFGARRLAEYEVTAAEIAARLDQGPG